MIRPTKPSVHGFPPLAPSQGKLRKKIEKKWWLRWLGLGWLGEHPSFAMTCIMVITLWACLSLTATGVLTVRRFAQG